MRTSTGWVLAAGLVLLSALATYNLALRRAYQRQLATAAPADYVVLNFQGFTEVVLPDSGSLSVKISQGPFQVRVGAQYAPLLHLHQQGRQLIVTADSTDALADDDMLLISCPRLTRVSTVPVVGPPTVAREGEGQCRTHIQGFRNDSLTLYQAERSRIVLSESNLKFLQVTVGQGPASYADLVLSADNRIEAASLMVNGRGQLSIYDLLIPKLRYEFADSAVLRLPGGLVPRQHQPSASR